MSKLSFVYDLFNPIADPKAAAWQEAYMRNQFTFLGVRKPLIARLLKPHAKDFSLNDIFDLWNAREREMQYAAMWLLRHQRLGSLEVFEQLVREKSWWDTVDEIAPHLIGPYVLKTPKTHQILTEWTADDHLWVRRSSLIYQLMFKDNTDESRLFDHCLRLKNDKDFFIRKAIGWALAQYKKTNPLAVENFLRKHGDELSSLSKSRALQ